MGINKSRSHVLLAATLIYIALVSGCARDREQRGGNISSGPGSAPARSASKKLVAAILPGDDVFYRAIRMGMNAAAREKNVELLTDVAATRQAVTKSIDAFTAKGVRALLISPLYASSSRLALVEAAKRDVKIVAYDGTMDEPFVVAAFQIDHSAFGATMGATVAKHMKARPGGLSGLAIVDGDFSKGYRGRISIRGFKQEIQRSGSTRIVAEVPVGNSVAAARVTPVLLQKHPEIDIIFAAGEDTIIAVVGAVKRAGKVGKVVVFGTGMNERIANLLLEKENVLQATVGPNSYEMGFRTLDAAAQVLEGAQVEKAAIVSHQLYSRNERRAVEAYLEQANRVREAPERQGATLGSG